MAGYSCLWREFSCALGVDGCDKQWVGPTVDGEGGVRYALGSQRRLGGRFGMNVFRAAGGPVKAWLVGLVEVALQSRTGVYGGN